MMKRTLALGLLAGAAIVGGKLAISDEFQIPNYQTPTSNPKANVSVLMNAKLAASHKIVEGLTAGDFEMLSKAGVQLQHICDSDQWRRHEDQVVTHYRSELSRAAIKLVTQAEQHNLDGAAYTYMHALSTCINCHQYSRDVLRVAKVPSGPVVSIPVTEQEGAAAQNYYPSIIR